MGAVELGLLATVGAVLLATRTKLPSQDVWRAYVLFAGFLGAYVLVQWLRRSGDPRPARRRPPRRQRPGMPAELTQVGDLLRAGTASRPEFDRGMRPLLREIVADRLLAVGVDPDRHQDQAERLLGLRFTELALTRGASQSTIQDRGPSPREIAELLDRLEAIGR